MINFYDFETFKYDWLVVIINPFNKTVDKIHNNPEALKKYYENHKNEIWCGFNSRHYDQFILKSTLLDFNPWEVNEHIITRDLPGWSFSSLFNKIPLINYDVMPLNSSLKQLEGFQGHNIHESGVDFRIDRPLTPVEIAETFDYCENDVEECINVWLENKSDFYAQLGLVQMFDLPLAAMSKTKAQISAEILECEKTDFNDEWDLRILECLRLNKYTDVKAWFLNSENHNYQNSLTYDVCGVAHQFGWGGIHGAKDKYHYKCENGHLILHVDVASYYPSLMIFQNLLTRASKRPERFKEIYDLRLKLKREGKKKEQAPLKIVLNGTFGICKDRNNKAYDPRQANNICVNGQLLLLDLLEKLERVPSFELIQSNTDGLIIKIHRDHFDAVDDICYEWESRTKMQLEFDYIKEIYQKDVNNYVFVQFDGKVERKGAYVKELSPIDYDLPILNTALVNYMLHGTPPEKTINDCDSLIEFQKICKLTKNYECVTHNGKKYTNKCYRIFASTRLTDGKVEKYRKFKGKDSFNKFQNTSDHSFIDNGDVTGKKVPAHLDRQFYIDMAYERLRQYGYENEQQKYLY